MLCRIILIISIPQPPITTLKEADAIEVLRGIPAGKATRALSKMEEKPQKLVLSIELSAYGKEQLDETKMNMKGVSYVCSNK